MRESTELTSSAREKSLMTSESLPDLLFPSQQRWGGLRCPGVSLQWDICEWDARACKIGPPTMSGAITGNYEVHQKSQHHPWYGRVLWSLVSNSLVGSSGVKSEVALEN